MNNKNKDDEDNSIIVIQYYYLIISYEILPHDYCTNEHHIWHILAMVVVQQRELLSLFLLLALNIDSICISFDLHWSSYALLHSIVNWQWWFVPTHYKFTSCSIVYNWWVITLYWSVSDTLCRDNRSTFNLISELWWQIRLLHCNEFNQKLFVGPNTQLLFIFSKIAFKIAFRILR